MPDNQGPIQAAAQAKERDGGQPLEDGEPGLGCAGLCDPLPTPEDTGSSDPVAERMFDAQAVLVPAKDLVGFFGVTYQIDVPRADYWHILFDRHHVLKAEGTWAESLFPGEEALKGLPCSSRYEIFTLFPQLRLLPHAAGFVPAYPFQRGAKVRKMFGRLVLNDRYAFDHSASKLSVTQKVG